MSTIQPGSTWKRWDLHIHTPESFYHNYPGDREEAWAAFLDDIEKLPSEFKVIGINDYVLVDGYERILKAKREQGRLKNIDLILPVVELRLDKFGGVAQGGGRGESSWSRINIHVIFDQVEPEFIRQQFISAIAPSYRLTPGSAGAGKWNQVISRESIEALGAAIIATVPADKQGAFGSPLMEGFNNLNVSADGLWRALDNQALCGKYVVAVGKTEWENLKWNDHTIAEKKTLINMSDLVFTAAESPERYAKARARLIDSAVNSKLLDCSDAHWLSSSEDKDRIGHCYTWIKADCTFIGLLQALQEFEDRVFIGHIPPKLELLRRNKTKFIRSVSVAKKPDSTLAETWFDLNIPLNPDLVAIIGNKGSGKSALSDILALAGSAQNYSSFSFLNPARFRNSRSRLAQHFNGALEWHDGSITSMDLDKDPAPTSVERVKYLPQSYLETLCNELGDKGSDTFDAELRKIIYSHVPEEDQLGQVSMDDLLKFKVAEINQARSALKSSVAKINLEILDIEDRMTAEFRRGLEEQLATKVAELSALSESKPQQVEDPNSSPEAQEESKQAAEEIEKLELHLQEILNEALGLRETKTVLTKKEAMARRISQALTNQIKQYENFVGELNELVAELGVELPINSLIQVKIDPTAVESIMKSAQADIQAIDAKLQNEDPDSNLARRHKALEAIADAKSKLGERQRLYVVYKENIALWERQKAEINGAPDKVGTILWLTAEIASLGDLPSRLEALKERRTALATEIHGHIQSMVDEYKRLYGPVQSFVQSAQQMDMELPLEFHVRIEESDFEDRFLNKLNRQVRGSFSGVDESGQLMRSMLEVAEFGSALDTISFASRLDQMLRVDERDGQFSRETRLIDQIRKGVEAQEVLDFLFGLEYLSPRYSLTYAGQEIGQLSPGERGLLLLVFYLLVDKDDIPIVIDQPEENLDNQTIYRILVKCIKKAKERRQVIMVTHNPNLAVVCDAEQIIFASCDKASSKFEYESGAMEHPAIKDRVVQVLEGTEPAFKNRQSKYRLI
ncbi:MAG: AAA family ATPase [Pseudohongiella sp.]|nr:AAA family ATPase [Pseudohongiella sp.]